MTETDIGASRHAGRSCDTELGMSGRLVMRRGEGRPSFSSTCGKDQTTHVVRIQGAPDSSFFAPTCFLKHFRPAILGRPGDDRN